MLQAERFVYTLTISGSHGFRGRLYGAGWRQPAAINTALPTTTHCDYIAR